MTDLVERVFAGDVRAAARLCRIVEDRGPGCRDELRKLYARGAHAHVIGVTGSPGAGKSTLVDRLITAVRPAGERVAVVAVDPTSPFSGGAILGDRVRMQRHFEDPDVFIRSVATRGALGGLSRSTSDVVRVLEAWGARTVLVETVGVGQDELDVTLLADTTLVVLSPGQGDDMQAIKAGILECADVFVVNKADRPEADITVRDLEAMLALGALTEGMAANRRHSAAMAVPATPGTAKWIPPIVKTVATDGRGIDELVRRAREHLSYASSEAGEQRRAARTRARLVRDVADELTERLLSELPEAVDAAVKRVISSVIDPFTAVDELLAEFRSRA